MFLSMRKTIGQFLRTMSVLVCADLICASLWAWGVVHSFESNVPKTPLAIVLAGDFDRETGEVGPETHRRLNRALDLYKQKTIDYVLCIGGARPRLKMYGSELMRQFLINAGIPQERVFLEKKSFDSYTNWYMAYGTIKSYGWNRVVAISSPFHLYRFRQIVNEDPKRRQLNVFYSPYTLKRTRPTMTYFDIWKQVHYEWLANLSVLLPKSIYKKLIRQMRGQ
jgi:uncharacterized SAM-binding protein YcdF (DUF218 family)